MSIALVIALVLIVFGAGFFLGMVVHSFYPPARHDHIRFTTHGEPHE